MADLRREKKLVELMKEFDLVDLLGFGKLMGVEEKENAEDFITETVVAFGKLGGEKQKQVLRLAKLVVEENRELQKEKKKKAKQSKD